MEHLTEDALTKAVLEVLDESEQAAGQQHLSSCPDCRSRFEDLKQQTTALGSVQLNLPLPALPLPLKRGFRAGMALRIAAVLVLGFLIGYLTSDLSQPCQTNVIPQYLQPVTEQQSGLNFVACEPVDTR